MSSEYATMFRLLINSSESAKTNFLAVYLQMVKKEVSTVTSQGTATSLITMRGEATINDIENFTWTSAIEEGRQKLPFVCNAIDASLPSKATFARQIQKGRSGAKRCMNDAEVSAQRDVRMGIILSIILYSNRPRVYKKIPSVLSAQMWRQGCSQKMFHSLQYLGISQGRKGAVGTIENLSKDFDRTLLVIKKNMEVAVPHRNPQPRRRLSFDDVPLGDDLHGFTMCWDNVQWESHRKHQSSDASSKMHLRALAFASRNRTESLHLTGARLCDAVDISPTLLVPSTVELSEYKERMILVVCNMLVELFPFLKDVHVPNNVPHENSPDMNSKSVMFTLGTLDENPSTNAGVIRIMEHLHKYVPKNPVDGETTAIVTSRDGLSIERMIGAQRLRSRSPTPSCRLEGLCASPQEFHKEGILLQDWMNSFFMPASSSEKGTLYHAKQFFKHKNVAKDVMSHFNHDWDFMKFFIQGLLMLCAQKSANIDDPNQPPDSFPLQENHASKVEWVKSLSTDIVNTLWIEPSREDIQKITEGYRTSSQQLEEPFVFCSCHEEKDGDMVLCCNSLCPNEWYHLECVGLHCVPLDDWYCSDNCEASDGYIYCTCKSKCQTGTMVQCCREAECRQNEWYHTGCIGVNSGDLPEKWYCCKQCECDDDDHILEHSKEILWGGLGLLVRRDAVREGDGPAMLSHWRMDLLQFWNKKHPKYLIIAFKLLSDVAGCVNERLRHELTWERTVNIHGKPSKNVGQDFANELINCDFKESLKHSRGNYTDAQLQRCSRMSGPFGKEVDRLIVSAGFETDMITSGERDKPADHYKEDLRLMWDIFKGEKLFEFTAKRRHKSFPKAIHKHELASSYRLGLHLKSIAEQKDFWDSVRKETQERQQETVHNCN